MDHVAMRDRVSAWLDGELDEADVVAVVSHLAGCAECDAFVAGARRLSLVAAALPADAVPAGLPERVLASVREAPAVSVLRPRPSRRRHTWLGVAAAVALVLGIATPLVLLPVSVPTVPLPSAGAAEGLQEIDAMRAVREIVDFDADGDPVRTTVERIWWRAPGYLRIERDIEVHGRSATELVVERPGERYVRRGERVTYETGLPPRADLVPEPLSPTIALVGNEIGPGPTIDGRETVRIEIVFGADDDQRRVVLADRRGDLVLGVEQTVVFDKVTTREEVPVQRKRTLEVELGGALDDGLFEIPDGPEPSDAGFRDAPAESLALEPAAIPNGFGVARSGTGPDGEAILYVRGSLPVLVSSRPPTSIEDDVLVDQRRVEVHGRPATMRLSLYGLPTLRFSNDGALLSLTAALPPDSLVDLAESMYP